MGNLPNLKNNRAGIIIAVRYVVFFRYLKIFTQMANPEISIIIPLNNEAELFAELINRLNGVVSQMKESCEIVLIDDGSTDDTAVLMKMLALADSRYQCVFLSRNFGHQIGITAGLQYARGTRGVMIMDGDLQDPPELISDFLAAYEEGYEVVYSVRKSRKESYARKITYKLYYRLLKSISNIATPLDSGDFAFLSRRVVDVLNAMPEEQRYLRGMRAWVGFSQKGVEYDRSGRLAGKSKYSLSKLMKLAYMGIFNFSELPIKFITVLGLLSTAGGLIYFVFTILRKLLWGDVPSGFTALIGAIVIFSGVQLISIGILGEYIVRIFYQVKQRPLFLVKERIINGQVESVTIAQPLKR
jgi:dolichol-phosphate mannosyltransferase